MKKGILIIALIMVSMITYSQVVNIDESYNKGCSDTIIDGNHFEYVEFAEGNKARRVEITENSKRETYYIDEKEIHVIYYKLSQGEWIRTNRLQDITLFLF